MARIRHLAILRFIHGPFSQAEPNAESICLTRRGKKNRPTPNASTPSSSSIFADVPRLAGIGLAEDSIGRPSNLGLRRDTGGR